MISLTLEDIKCSNIKIRRQQPIVINNKEPIICSFNFNNHDVVAHKMWYLHAFSIFDPKKTSKLDSSEYSNYVKDSLNILLHQYGLPRTVLSLDGEEFQKQAVITDEVYAEWTTFHHYIAKKPKEDISSQLYDLSTNEMLKPMFPNLRNVCMSLPVGMVSVERSFSKMKMIKT